MGDILKKLGFSVITYGCENETAHSMEEAVDAPSIISGIPLTKDESKLCAAVWRDDMTIKNLIGCLKTGQRFYAGCIPQGLMEHCQQHAIDAYDFMKDNNLTLYNTIATAEGAIAEALLHQPTNLHRAKCLILGYGKCAKVLAKKVRGLEADVTICARGEDDLSLADAFGYDTLPFQNWKLHLYNFEYIFNTVPSVIMDRETLLRMRKDAIIIDIASAPGGVDYEEAENLGIHAHQALGLPGKYAPRSTAEALIKTVLSRG